MRFLNFFKEIKWFRKPPVGYKRLTPVNVSKMEYDQKRGFTVLLEHPMFAVFTQEIISYFKKAGGINYVSFCAWDAKIGEIEITVRPKSGKTKTQIITELKEEIKKLKSQLKL